MTNPVTQRTNTLDQWRINLNTIGNNVGDPAGLYSADGSDNFVLPNANMLVAAINDLNTRKVKRSGDTIANLAITTSLTIGTTLGVTGVSTLSNATASTLPTNGALVVTGGIGVGGTVNIGGNASVLSNTASSSTTTGALVVTGGIGIGGAVNIGGVATLSNATASTSPTTGALVVTGGVGVGGAVNIGGAVAIAGAVTVAASGGVTAQSFIATNSTYVQGSFGVNGAQGTVIMAKTGTSFDFSLINPGNNQYIMTVPTGTFNVNFPGAVSITGTLSLSSAVTFNQVTVNSTLGVTGQATFAVSPIVPTQALSDNSTFAINSSWLKSYFTPINNNGAVSDLALGVGQVAFVDYLVAAAGLIPLHIAVTPGQIYEMVMVSTTRPNAGAGFYLYPNNVNYGNVFIYREIYGSNNTPYALNSAAGGYPPYVGVNGGYLFFARGHVSTATPSKMWQFTSQESSPTVSYVGLMGNEWNDTTTPWTSLGSIYTAVGWNGRIWIKRLS